MDEIEQEWMKTMGEAMKTMHADQLIVQAPGSTLYVGGQHAHLHQAPATTAQPNGETQEPSEESSNTDEPIIAQLAGCFFGIKSAAADFLAKVKAMKPTQITELVTQLVREGSISPLSCKTDLWRVLHDNGLYKPSRQCWGQQVQISPQRR